MKMKEIESKARERSQVMQVLQQSAQQQQDEEERLLQEAIEMSKQL